jgi:very-short-patch-repair endonuclease
LGIPVTSIARTLVDLCTVCTPHQLAAALREAEFHNLLDVVDVYRTIDRAGQRSQVHKLHEALELRHLQEAGTRSYLEDLMLEIINSAGIPSPRVNVPFQTKSGVVEVDMAWPDAQVCVEVDGPGHLRPAERIIDEHRDRLLSNMGFVVLRFSADEIRNRSHNIARSITHALARNT